MRLPPSSGTPHPPHCRSCAARSVLERMATRYVEISLIEDFSATSGCHSCGHWRLTRRHEAALAALVDSRFLPRRPQVWRECRHRHSAAVPTAGHLGPKGRNLRGLTFCLFRAISLHRGSLNRREFLAVWLRERNERDATSGSGAAFVRVNLIWPVDIMAI